jgi:endonuclease/exonuclease/phosphatase family metal-dependent hydrolase
LKIATYNVENLFDLKHNGNEYEEYIPNKNSEWNEKNYKIKLKNIAQVLHDINADIVALQEIESLDALKDLRYTLKRNGVYYEYYAFAHKKNSTVNVAILSKIPFKYAKEVSVTSSLKYRNILEVKFIIDDQEFYIFNNHWKAKTGSESQRVVSAKALMKRVKEIGINKNIILLGDFNSNYNEKEDFLRNRKLNDTNGKTGINDVLHSYTEQNPFVYNFPKEESFYNLWLDQKAEKRYTNIFRGKKETPDNILVSYTLLNQQSISYKQESLSNFHPEYLFEKNKIYRWQMSRKKPSKHIGKGYSDHLPLVAEFIIH